MAVPSVEKAASPAANSFDTTTDLIKSKDEQLQPDSEATRQIGKPNFGLQIGVEDILVDVDPNVSLEFLQKANALAGRRPPHRASRDKLVATHSEHVKKMAGKREAAVAATGANKQKKAPRMVKKVILALSYPPSVKPVSDLERVSTKDSVFKMT